MEFINKVFVACDHAGFALKEQILEAIPEAGMDNFKFIDTGCYSAKISVDYPVIAHTLCGTHLKLGGCNWGLIICGTGIGVSMCCNRHKHIRCALCHNEFTARMAREHNDANVLALGGKVLDPDMAIRIVRVFFNTEFNSREPRHSHRVQCI